MIRHKYVQLQNNYNIAVLFRCYFTWESRKERERKKKSNDDEDDEHYCRC